MCARICVSENKYRIRQSTYHFWIFINGFHLNFEFVDLPVVGVVWHSEVIHCERPERGIELRADVIPDLGGVQRDH